MPHIGCCYQLIGKGQIVHLLPQQLFSLNSLGYVPDCGLEKIVGSRASTRVSCTVAGKSSPLNPPVGPIEEVGARMNRVLDHLLGFFKGWTTVRLEFRGITSRVSFPGSVFRPEAGTSLP